MFGTMRLIVVIVARGWLVLAMTDSPFWVALAPALRGGTHVLVGTVSGALLDRINRKMVLVIAEIGNSVMALGIGLLVITGQIELWHILAASVVEGIFISFRWPAMNTMLLETVKSERVLNASAAQLTAFNLGNIVAASVAGLLIVAFGVGEAYLFATLCGFFAAGCAWFVSGDFQPKAVLRETFVGTLRSGLRYVWTSKALRWVLTLSFAMNLLGWSHASMMPVMARDVLGVDASGLGFLTTAGGIGAFIATLFVAGLGDYRDKLRLMLRFGSMASIALILFALSPWYSLSLVIKAVLQGGLMGFEATISAVVLLLTSEQMQGRVQGIYALLFGFTWLGGVVLGSLASIAGAPIAIGLSGVVVGITAVALRRPILQINNLIENDRGRT
jgi:MFS family permease